MDKWEYMAVPALPALGKINGGIGPTGEINTTALNHWGERGWELVSIVAMPSPNGTLWNAVFKRRKP